GGGARPALDDVGDGGGEVAFLHDGALGGVELAEDFDQRGEAGADVAVEGGDVEQVAVHADAEEEVLGARLEVDIGGVAAETDQENQAQEQWVFTPPTTAACGIVEGFAAGVDQVDGVLVEVAFEEGVGGAAEDFEIRVADEPVI